MWSIEIDELESYTNRRKIQPSAKYPFEAFLLS